VTKAEKATIGAGALLCLGAATCPPFVDPYVFEGGPVFAELWNPRPSVNDWEGLPLPMTIDWSVLQAEWAITVLFTGSVWLGLARPPKFSLAQRVVLWLGAAGAIYPTVLSTIHRRRSARNPHGSPLVVSSSERDDD
jgi:hypothetical protein